MGAGDRAPAGLGGLDQLEHHRERRGRAAGPAGAMCRVGVSGWVAVTACQVELLSLVGR